MQFLSTILTPMEHFGGQKTRKQTRGGQNYNQIALLKAEALYLPQIYTLQQKFFPLDYQEFFFNYIKRLFLMSVGTLKADN